MSEYKATGNHSYKLSAECSINFCMSSYESAASRYTKLLYLSSKYSKEFIHLNQQQIHDELELNKQNNNNTNNKFYFRLVPTALGFLLPPPSRGRPA